MQLPFLWESQIIETCVCVCKASGGSSLANPLPSEDVGARLANDLKSPPPPPPAWEDGRRSRRSRVGSQSRHKTKEAGCKCNPSRQWVRKALVTSRSRVEVAEKHPKTVEHSTLNINSPVCPPCCPFSPQTRGTRVDFALLGRAGESGYLGIGGGCASEGSQVQPWQREGAAGALWAGTASAWRESGRPRGGSGEAPRMRPGLASETAPFLGKPGGPKLALWEGTQRRRSEWIRRGSSRFGNRPLRTPQPCFNNF